MRILRIHRAPVVFDRSMREYDLDGRMFVSDANISKACINPYRGSEIPDYIALGLEPNKIYQMYRDPVELEEGADSFNGVQLMIVHKAVSAQQPEQRLAVGSVYNTRFRSPYLVADLAVWTQDAVKKIEKRLQDQLSCGYRYRADMSPGVLQGQRYDGIMRDIRGNHVALVVEGRVGPDAVVPDELPRSLKHMRFPKLIAKLAPFLALDADLEALDAELEKIEKADDEKPEGMDAKAWDEMSPEEKKEAKAKDKKAKDKKAKDEAEKAAKDKRAKDAAGTPNTGPSTLEGPIDPERTNPGAGDAGGLKPQGMDAALKRAGVVTVDEMNKAIAAGVTAAVRANSDLLQAREDVKPFVGTAGMAFDSADAVYAHALKHLKVDVEGVHPSAYRTLVTEIRKARSASVKAGPRGVAMDAARPTTPPPSIAALFAPMEDHPTVQ
jgi:hypothetical protein